MSKINGRKVIVLKNTSDETCNNRKCIVCRKDNNN